MICWQSHVICLALATNSFFPLLPSLHKKHGMSALVRLLLRKVDRCRETGSVEINSHKLFLLLLNKIWVNRVMDECCQVLGFEVNLWFWFGLWSKDSYGPMLFGSWLWREPLVPVWVKFLFDAIWF
jgi:hypothetical protein